MKKIYYIQKEETQLGSKTVFAPIFYTDYDKAKIEFLEYIKSEKEDLHYIEKETEGFDLISIHGSDEWGEINKIIYLRSGEIN